MKKSLLFLLLGLSCVTMPAKDYLVKTHNTMLVLNGEKGQQVKFVYYGPTMPVSEIRATRNAVNKNAFPTFGNSCTEEHALQITHGNGDTSLDLSLEEVKEYREGTTEVTEFVLKDKLYPVDVHLIYKSIPEVDIIKISTVIKNHEKKPIVLQRFSSAYLPIKSNDLWISYLVGGWASECNLIEEPLHRGRKVISNQEGARTSFTTHPSFMVSYAAPKENCGTVIGGTYLWPGNYELSFYRSYNDVELTAGINPEASAYHLEKDETFETPELVLTCSTEGKGGVSRNLHRWARKYQIIGGQELRDILLNSWEGVYMKVNQEAMAQMMKGFSEIGGELFVMDDGWFGEKYPRNTDKTSLGDWKVCQKKLPQGIGGLIQTAREQHLKFGIWIEPEMVSLKSELFEKHPDWALKHPQRSAHYGRGGTQMILDMSNPEVQEHVFNVVDRLMQNYPDIYYMKWDANTSIHNAYSPYLAKDRQSHVYIEYTRGLLQTLQRIRQKYPHLVMQLCGGGGARTNLAYMPYFNECWPSDNTDAVQRLFIQWGTSQYYPSNMIASHVSASPNHQTGRVVPLKFRFDVAMTGRLGMEMKPSDLTAQEKAFAKDAIATYKNIRPVVQQGDLYRLISPYENKHYVSLMYVTPDKNRAVYFLFRHEFLRGRTSEPRILAGLDSNKKYRFHELNVPAGKRKSPLDGAVISGKTLMQQGFYLDLNGALTSTVFELVAEE